MNAAVLVPPLRLFRLGCKNRRARIGLLVALLLHFGLSKTLAEKAVIPRTLPLLIVHTPPSNRKADRLILQAIVRSSIPIGRSLSKSHQPYKPSSTTPK